MSDDDDLLPQLPGYISVHQAADILKVAERTVYGYIDDGKLPAVRVGSAIALEEQVVKKFRRQATGRPRTRIPTWRLPVGKNIQYLTIIFASLRPGQESKLQRKLKEIHSGEKHLLPGTVARYIARNEEKPNEVQIVLVWRSTVMPPEEEREAALAALREELAEMLDWETAWSETGKVLMHT
jgi:excisionase family DNA binding protein